MKIPEFWKKIHWARALYTFKLNISSVEKNLSCVIIWAYLWTVPFLVVCDSYFWKKYIAKWHYYFFDACLDVAVAMGINDSFVPLLQGFKKLKQYATVFRCNIESVGKIRHVGHW